MTSDKPLHTFHSDTLRIVCVSDTHGDNCLQDIPSGDIFVHTGDFTDDGTPEELEEAFTWISKLPHPVKIIVAGKSTP
jgi:3',5'-cyclic AMP phosphodiesterase CpdA